MDLYVYYRCAVKDAEMVRSHVASLQRDLRMRHGVRCGLKRRPQATDSQHTWMEIYLATPPGFEAVLDVALAATALPELIIGSRHTEHFADCLPCA